MIAIYSNNYFTDHCIQQLKFSDVYCVYYSIAEYQSAQSDLKIAFVNHINSYELPVSEQQRLDWYVGGRKFFQEIDQLESHSNLLFAFDTEIHPYHVDVFEKYKQSNIVWVIPGQINHGQNCIPWNMHFDFQTTLYNSNNLKTKLREIQHNSVKPLYFDALLGQSRIHRDFVYQMIVDNDLQEKSLTTYIDTSLPLEDAFKKCLIWESNIENFDHTITRTPEIVRYHGQEIALCRIVPISVYNRCAYSVVAETGHSNYYSFFTEKTAKPMIARRLFVVFSGCNFLQNLRALGFQTFGNVIDESYDSIYNDHDRWSAAFEQVKRLCNMDQQEVFAKIAETTEHNYSVLVNTNWQQLMLTQLQQKLTQHLTTTHV